MWTFDGEEVNQFSGHTSFIFSVNYLSFGLYISGADDRNLKVWKDN